VPRFQDAARGLLTIAIQSFLIRRNGLTILVDFLLRQRQGGADAAGVSPCTMAVASTAC